MRTIYIKGIKKFKKGIGKGLDKSELIEGKDYIQGLAGSDFALYWINENIALRDFKKAISAKYVFKHRLQFFNSIEEMNPEKDNDELSLSEIELMNRVKENFLNPHTL